MYSARLGGDCDTLTCNAGSIAEGFYGVPEKLKEKCVSCLDAPMAAIVRRWEGILHSRDN